MKFTIWSSVNFPWFTIARKTKNGNWIPLWTNIVSRKEVK